MTTILNQKELPSRDGFDLRAVVVPDDLSTPENQGFDHWDDVVAAYKREEWSFVAVMVFASKAGIDLGWDCQSGCVYGQWPLSRGGTSWNDPLVYLDNGGEYCNMIPNAIERGKTKLAELTA